MKTYFFYNQMEQENGDELQDRKAGEVLQLLVPDGFKLERVDTNNAEDYVYTLTTADSGQFKFTILPAVEIPNMPIPAQVIIRKQGDKEGEL